MKALAHCAEAVAAAPGRNEKIARVAAYLETLEDQDLARAVLYLSGRAFPASDRRKLSVGHATLREALVRVTGWDLEMIATCYREVGDTGETVALLVRRHTAGREMSLAQAEALYEELEQSRRTAQKVELLAEAFRSYDWLQLKYFVKGITGNLRIGLQEKMVEEALAAATGLSAEAVRGANNRSGGEGRYAGRH
jgi:DNA ligase-1